MFNVMMLSFGLPKCTQYYVCSSAVENIDESAGSLISLVLIPRVRVYLCARPTGGYCCSAVRADGL